MRKYFVLFLLAAVVFPVFSQQFAKTGIVNLSRIYTQFYKESKGVKEFDDLKASIQKDVDKYKDEIRQLNDQKLDAQTKGDTERAQSLERDIQKKQDDLLNFAKSKQEILKQKSDTVKNDNGFKKMLNSEIEQEAISKGFALILSAENAPIVWYGPDADITDGVILRLQADLK